MPLPPLKHLVAICETQPVTADGLRILLSGSDDLVCHWSLPSLAVALHMNKQRPAHVLLLDRAFGAQALSSAIAELRSFTPDSGIVIWGASLSESDALRFLQSGARGILRKSCEPVQILSCLRTVAGGETWVEDSLFRDSFPAARSSRSDLTSREREVLGLVKRGFKNREIATELGIRPGTVKIHMKHIFEKTGVHGRYGLALEWLRQRKAIELPTPLELSHSA